MIVVPKSGADALVGRAKTGSSITDQGFAATDGVLRTKPDHHTCFASALLRQAHCTLRIKLSQ
jgi:hypothetical protein